MAEELIATAVNESLSDPDRILQDSCISWICHNNTIMKNFQKNGTNIRIEFPSATIYYEQPSRGRGHQVRRKGFDFYLGNTFSVDQM